MAQPGEYFEIIFAQACSLVKFYWIQMKEVKKWS